MKKTIDSVTLANKEGQSLLIYKVEGSTSDFAIGLENGDHFFFSGDEAQKVIDAILEVSNK
jgi:hypothetical protein